MRDLARPFILLVVLLGTCSVPAAAQDSLRDRVKLGVTEEVVVSDYPPMPLRSMTSAAGAVVHVLVRSHDTFLSPDGLGVLTDYRMTVVDVVKHGAGVGAGDVITLRRTGGVMDIEGRRFSSVENRFPAFRAGGEYVLFLRTDEGQPFRMLAGPQSAFAVQRGAVAPVAGEADGAAVVLLPLFVHDVRELVAERVASR